MLLLQESNKKKIQILTMIFSSYHNVLGFGRIVYIPLEGNSNFFLLKAVFGIKIIFRLCERSKLFINFDFKLIFYLMIRKNLLHKNIEYRLYDT